jgi:hypothetical protein
MIWACPFSLMNPILLSAVVWIACLTVAWWGTPKNKCNIILYFCVSHLDDKKHKKLQKKKLWLWMKLSWFSNNYNKSMSCLSFLLNSLNLPACITVACNNHLCLETWSSLIVIMRDHHGLISPLEIYIYIYIYIYAHI